MPIGVIQALGSSKSADLPSALLPCFFPGSILNRPQATRAPERPDREGSPHVDPDRRYRDRRPEGRAGRPGRDRPILRCRRRRRPRRRDPIDRARLRNRGDPNRRRQSCGPVRGDRRRTGRRCRTGRRGRRRRRQHDPGRDLDRAWRGPRRSHPDRRSERDRAARGDRSRRHHRRRGRPRRRRPSRGLRGDRVICTAHSGH